MSIFTDRLQHAWNVFIGRDPPIEYYATGYSSTYRQDRARLSRGNDRSIIASIYNRIAIDVASIKIVHVRLDDKKRFSEEIESTLNNCFQLSANIDQTGRDFFQDACLRLLEEGCVALVPIETENKLEEDKAFSILSVRAGTVTEWFPKYVKIKVYNELKGYEDEIILPKTQVALVYNPLYSVMNEPNSTLQRLIRKLAIMDNLDNQTSSGKLDLIIQLPYVVKTKGRQEQAERRRKDIEFQLSSSKYGVAYTDGTERITQLNRPVENNLLPKIEYLRNELYSQLGLTTAIMDGTADEKTMLNYYNRTIEPIVSAFVDEMKRKFLTETARTQKQSIMFFRDPFKLVPVEQLAELADKFTRNEIMSSNEFRSIVGREPSKDPQADELRNKNLNASPEQQFADTSNNQERTDHNAVQ